MPRNSVLTVERREPAPVESVAGAQESWEATWAGEAELLREFVRALRTIRYGSVILTLHDGRIVEIQKTERIRRNGSKDSAASPLPK